MKRLIKSYECWLAPLLAFFFFFGLSRITYFRFENSDDILYVKAFMGFEGQVASSPPLYLHPLLVWLLGLLSNAMPGVAWFSLLQIGMLLLSAWALCIGILRCANAARVPAAAGTAAALLFLAVFASFIYTRINHTTTSAVLGAAACALLLGAAAKRTHVFSSVLCSAAALAGACMLRTNSMPALICFWGLSLLYLCLCCAKEGEGRPSLRQCMRFAKHALPRAIAVCAIAAIALVSMRMVEINQNKDFYDFHEARADLLDYRADAMNHIPDNVLEQLGWSEAELELVREWYFMDENITADAFRLIQQTAWTEPGIGARLSNASSAVLAFLKGNSTYVFALILLLLLGTLAFLPREAGFPGARITALASLALMAAMVFYLSYQGRLLPRAVDCAMLPAAAVLTCLSLRALSRQGKRGLRIAALCLCAACLIPTALSLRQTHYTLTRRADTVSPAREANLEAFALENPEYLILRTPNLLRDTRLLPDVSAGTPSNVMIWGDWLCRTPGWNAQLSRFGFDPAHFSATDFLSKALLFVTEEDAPPDALLQSLARAPGAP